MQNYLSHPTAEIGFVNRWSGVQFPHPAPKKPLGCGDFFDFLRSFKTQTNGTKRTQNRGAGTQKGTQSPRLLVSDFLGPFCTMAKAKPTLPVRTIGAGEDPFAIHLLVQSADLAAAMGYELPDDLKKEIRHCGDAHLSRPAFSRVNVTAVFALKKVYGCSGFETSNCFPKLEFASTTPAR
ncbi:MAG: hypothetical protein WBD96_15125, partial [Pseudolabrys sp.]